MTPRPARASVLGYGVALTSVAAAFVVRYACDRWLGERAAQDFFLAATAVSAWYGGAGPSVVSIVLSTLLGLWFFVQPRHTLLITDDVDLVETLSFLFSASAIAYLSCAMKQATARARESAEQARREIEERRKVERQLQDLNERLEERVDQRTVDLRLALRELEAYAYSIAHNLRAPLRGIAGLSDLLLEEERSALGAQGQKRLASILEATHRMDDLILGLLDYSRASRDELPLKPLALAEAVDEALHDLVRDLESKDAEVIVEGPLPEILANRQALVRVIFQLVSNAAKFVAPGVHPQIRIGWEKIGDRMRLWIQDNGIGIDPSYHEKVFGVFERLHLPEEYPGTGIGLAIVRKCMERMGGRAWVDSQLGQGSRFWIEAALAPAPALARSV